MSQWSCLGLAVHSHRPVKTSTVCALWNYKRGLRKETPPGRHSQMGRGNTGNWRGLWDPSGKTRSPDFRPCPHQQQHHRLSSISIPVVTAQRSTTCSKAIPLCRKVPPAAAAVPLSLLRAPTESGLISLVQMWLWTCGYRRMRIRAGVEPCKFPSEVKTSRGMGWLSVPGLPLNPTELPPAAAEGRGSQAGVSQRQVGTHLAKHRPGLGGRAALQGQFFL